MSSIGETPLPDSIASLDGPAAVEAPAVVPFSLARVLRLSSFQIGSAMGDILVTSVWNRIMISNLGIPAWPVGLLIALRYLLSPLSLWAGYRSDTRPLGGLHRTPYIWAGRLMMVVSFPLLGASLGRFADDPGDPIGWLIAVLCFLLYGAGTLISGSPYLTLVRDSMPPARRGLAVSIVETVLIAFFPVAAIGFGYWLEAYSLARFWQLALFVMVAAGFFWWFAISGVERPRPANAAAGDQTHLGGFRATFRQIWRDRRTRRFFVFLALGILAAWAQDNILEPFGADVFQMAVGQTTRLNAYWQSATVVTLVLAVVRLRRQPPERQSPVTRLGLVIMTAGMLLLAAAAFGEQLRAMQLALVAFGAGFGLFTFGAFSLMVAMTTDREAGAYLGLWTICVLVARGLGISLGSLLRDILLAFGFGPAAAYGTIFGLEALGLVSAALILSGAGVLSFAADRGGRVTEPAALGLDL